eukprot:Hpha_TRINITY_DN15039_c1_g1::TRINITY_DN15039_c1_g1_i1::g.124857::m.124857
MRAAAPAARRAATRAYCTHPFNYTDTDLKQSYFAQDLSHKPSGVAAAASTVHSSGIRIVSKDLGGPSSSVAFWIDAGAIYESTGKAGVSDAVAEMLFSSNLASSDYHVFKTYQAAAASTTPVQVGKRWIGAKVQCRRDLVPIVVQRLSENLFIPRFAGHELTKVREVLENKTVTRDHDAQQYAADRAVEAAFTGSPLGNLVTVPEYNVDNLTSADLIDHWSKFFVAPRIILAGVNVSNEELSTSFDSAEFSNLATNTHSHDGHDLLPLPTEQSSYVGGQSRSFSRLTEKFPGQKFYDDAHVVYARRAFGRQSLKDYAATLVSQALLGGPSRTLAAGASTGYLQSFDQVGLLGVQLRSRPDAAGEQVKAAAAAVNGLGSSSAEDVAVAKKVASVAFEASTSSHAGLLSFFAVHSGASGLAAEPEDIQDAISAVTQSDIKRVSDYAQAAPATLAAVGDLSTVPAIQAL